MRVTIKDVSNVAGISEQALRRHIIHLLEHLDLDLESLTAIYVNTQGTRVRQKVVEKMIRKIKNEYSELDEETRKLADKLLEILGREYDRLTSNYT
jgi:hypothetical protein